MTDGERLAAQRRRRMVVDLLADDPEGSASAFVLSAALNLLGDSAGFEQVDAELGWLAKKGLVKFVHETEELRLARVTEKGMTVAAGSLHVPGVAKRIQHE